MGEIADDMLSGYLCSWCGVALLPNDAALPALCPSCWDDASPVQRDALLLSQEDDGSGPEWREVPRG